MSGLIGKKIGMTSIFDEKGKNIPCTVIEAGPCVVTQIKSNEVDGYSAVQLGFNDKSDKQSNKAEAGHFSKSKSSAKYKLVEFQNFDEELNLGDSVSVDHFTEGEFVDVSGNSKGKGFQGVVKREVLVYDATDAIGATGGSLGLFLGFSFFDLISKCMDNLIIPFINYLVSLT